MNNGKIAEASERISIAMRDKNMKQSELAELSGISKQSINAYMSGRYEPKQTALYKMAKILDVAEMWLAGYDIPKERTLQQKENDAIADLTDRMLKEKEFRQMILKINSLNSEQLAAVNTLLNAFHLE